MNSYKDKIFGFYTRYRRMPNYQEIMDLVGFKSKNAVSKLIDKLIDEGVVTKDSKGKLSPTKMIGELPLLGLVEAGFPTIAEEEVLETLSLDNYLIKHRDSSYLLEVKGDSMIEEGIKEGDLVIVERTGVAKDGDIVIAGITFSPSDILKELDPVAYNEEFNHYLDDIGVELYSEEV